MEDTRDRAVSQMVAPLKRRGRGRAAPAAHGILTPHRDGSRPDRRSLPQSASAARLREALSGADEGLVELLPGGACVQGPPPRQSVDLYTALSSRLAARLAGPRRNAASLGPASQGTRSPGPCLERGERARVRGALAFTRIARARAPAARRLSSLCGCPIRLSSAAAAPRSAPGHAYAEHRAITTDPDARRRGATAGACAHHECQGYRAEDDARRGRVRCSRLEEAPRLRRLLDVARGRDMCRRAASASTLPHGRLRLPPRRQRARWFPITCPTINCSVHAVLPDFPTSASTWLPSRFARERKR